VPSEITAIEKTTISSATTGTLVLKSSGQELKAALFTGLAVRFKTDSSHKLGLSENTTYYLRAEHGQSDSTLSFHLSPDDAFTGKNKSTLNDKDIPHDFEFFLFKVPVVVGDAGNDVIYANTNDKFQSLHGGKGEDTLYASASSADAVFGDADKDTLVAFNPWLGVDPNVAKPNRLYGGDDSDTIVGGASADLIKGEGGDDHLAASVGNDTISAGDGSDVLVSINPKRGESSYDILDGQSGTDTYRFSGEWNIANIRDKKNGSIDLEGISKNYVTFCRMALFTQPLGE
jgi:Ca2+-binding RTX toxin-like protein